MLMRNRPTANESGSTLPIVVILSFVMLVTIAGVFELGVQDAGLAARNEDSIQALFLAEGGLSEGVAWLKAQNVPPAGVSPIEPLGAAPDTLGVGTYAVMIQPDAANAGRSQKIYTIRSTGAVGGKTRTLTRDVTTQSFAQFIYFTDLECMAGTGTPIWFMSHDYLDGPIHSNGHIHIMGSPYFGGHLTSAWGGPGDPDPTHNPSFMYYNNGWSYVESSAASNAPYDYPTFDAGYELGASHIELPQNLTDLKVMSQNGGLYLNGNYNVEFSREVDGAPLWGTVSYKPFRDGVWVDVALSSINGVIYVDGQSRVWGTLDGVATVASAGSMWIMDDIVYRDADPVNGPNPGCDDVLGPGVPDQHHRRQQRRQRQQLQHPRAHDGSEHVVLGGGLLRRRGARHSDGARRDHPEVPRTGGHGVRLQRQCRDQLRVCEELPLRLQVLQHSASGLSLHGHLRSARLAGGQR